MARYSISDTTLTALGDAVRSKVGETRKGLALDKESYDLTLAPHSQIMKKLSSGNAYNLKILLTGTHYENIQVAYIDRDSESITKVFDENNECFISRDTLKSSTTNAYIQNISDEECNFTIDIIKMDDNGNEILKEVDILNTMTPLQMAEEINNLASPPTATDLIIRGNCNYMFYQGVWDWVIEKYGNQITTTKLINISDMFGYSKVQSIPFELNFDGSVNEAVRAFTGSKITELPKINNFQPNNIQSMFMNVPNLKVIPDDYFDNWDFSFLDTATSVYTGNMSNLFNDSKALRKLPLTIFEHGNPAITASYSVFKDTFNYCVCLDEIIGMPNPHTGTAYNQSGYSGLIGSNFLAYTYRLKNFTFRDMPAVQWANQTLDLSKNAGWGTADLTQYGIPDGKQVNDDATYQALKDDPDWWSMKVEYSRYNHDSAVRTINSLPSAIEYQTSSGKGANVIKFKGGAGSKTDGGAINTLTEEEIAVATAKGWTVSLV